MKNPFFTGACTALITPFKEGKINYAMVETLLNRQIEAGIEAVVMAGTTGEAPTLSDAEKLELFRFSKRVCEGQCKVIAGTGSNSTAHTIALSRAAEDVGADGLLLVTPYYNKATHDGLTAHYIAAASAVEIPVILYNVPGRTGLDIPLSVYERLAKVPNIVGVKEASTDVAKITRLKNTCPGLTVWTGCDELITPVMALGASGVISVVSNILPEETQALTRAALAGDFDTAADLQCRLQPLIDLLFCEVSPVPVKAALELMGYDCGPCRMPLGRLSDGNLRKLKEYFHR